MTINTITFGNNKFCGPAVISSIAGITTDEAEKLIQDLRKNTRNVTVVEFSEISRVLQSLGFKTMGMQYPRNSSLYYLMISGLLKNGIYLIMVKGHAIAIEIEDKNVFIIDNHTKKPINLAASARLNQPVLCLVKVWK